MRIVRFNRGYTLHLTNHEMDVLHAIMAATDLEAVHAKLESGHRRAIGRRGGLRNWLRLDDDKRTGWFKGLP